jgi:hypothetical protein
MKINPSLVCELVGDDVVFLDPEKSAVVTLTGDSAVVVRRLLAGDTVSDTEPGVDKLLSQRIVIAPSSSGLSRRSLVATGAAVGAGGIFALSLPAAANSSSPGEPIEPSPQLSLPAPEFELSDSTYWYGYSDQGDDFVEYIQIVKVDLKNQSDYDSLEEYTLEWGFFEESPDEGWEEFDDEATRWVWDEDRGRVGSSPLLSPKDNWDDGNRELTIWVRVRSGSQLSPAVELVLSED